MSMFGSLFGKKSIESDNEIERMVLLPDGDTALTMEKEYLRSWDLKSGKQIRSMAFPEDRLGDELAITADGSLVAVSLRRGGPSSNLSLLLADSRTLESVQKIELPAGPRHDLAFSADGKLIATSNMPKEQNGLLYRVALWDVANGKSVMLLASPSRPAKPAWGFLSGIAFSIDRHLAAGSGDGMITVWSLDTQQEVFTLNGHSPNSTDKVAFTAQGNILVSSGGSEPTVKLWDWRSRKNTVTISGMRASPVEIAISKSGLIATAGADPIVRLWNLEGRCLRTFGDDKLEIHNDAVRSLAFNLDGTLLVAAGHRKKSGGGIINYWKIKPE